MIKTCKKCGKQYSGDVYPKTGRLCQECFKEYQKEYQKIYKNKNTIAKCSSATPIKQEGLAHFLNYHMDLTKAVLTKHSYYPDTYVYIDTNAGYGYNDGAIGSPLIFLEKARAKNMKHEAHFIELNSEYTDILQNKLSEIDETGFVHNGDHAEILPKLCKGLRKDTFGLIYHDPNGVPSFSMLSNDVFKSNTRKLDLLIRVSATGIKRKRTANPGNNNKTLADCIKSIPKSTWLIYQVKDKDPWQWTFLFGTNYAKLSAYQSAGFYRLDSDEGQEMLQKLSLTKKELDDLNNSRER
jgi:three-Cys-motif partner protein